MMSQKRFTVQPARYKLVRGELTMVRSLSSLMEDFARATGIKKANETVVLKHYREQGYTVTKGK